MSSAQMGARVRYCGHRGVFIADIYEFRGVNVVKANYVPKNAQDFLDRAIKMGNYYDVATHQLEDFPMAGFWQPDIGVFVVPTEQVTEIKR